MPGSLIPDRERAIRRALEALGRGDHATAVAIYAPDGVWDMTATGLGVFTGHEAIRGFMEDWREPYDELQLKLEELRDLGNGVTLACVAQRGRLRGSGLPVLIGGGYVGVWRDTLIERNTFYLDIDEARAGAERLAEERD
jgi:ketosteroid isomerase-like protein